MARRSFKCVTRSSAAIDLHQELLGFRFLKPVGEAALLMLVAGMQRSNPKVKPEMNEVHESPEKG
jgi:hypothetical protein